MIMGTAAANYLQYPGYQNGDNFESLLGNSDRKATDNINVKRVSSSIFNLLQSSQPLWC